MIRRHVTFVAEEELDLVPRKHVCTSGVVISQQFEDRFRRGAAGERDGEATGGIDGFACGAEKRVCCGTSQRRGVGENADFSVRQFDDASVLQGAEDNGVAWSWQPGG